MKKVSVSFLFFLLNLNCSVKNFNILADAGLASIPKEGMSLFILLYEYKYREFDSFYQKKNKLNIINILFKQQKEEDCLPQKVILESSLKALGYKIEKKTNNIDFLYAEDDI